jgi:alkaline phosphatase
VSVLAAGGATPAMGGADHPRNVVLLIGDGMGLGQLSLARVAGGHPLQLDSMPVVALVQTAPVGAVVPDSAATATAMASGQATTNGRIGELPDGTPVLTVLEAAEAQGRSSGLVTTTTITHATPAAFAAHVPSRSMEAEIAAGMLASGVDVLLGGGRRFFLPPEDAPGESLEERARVLGFDVVHDRAALLASSADRILGLFQGGGMTTRPPEPTLAEMTGVALKVLARDPDGFFLMAEGGQIDWACHDNDAADAIHQLEQFDETVGRVLAFARRRGDTLVVVTADHETGGLALVADGSGYRVAWITTDHTATDVGLFAEGPGAEAFGGVLRSRDIGRRIARVWGLRGLPEGRD